MNVVKNWSFFEKDSVINLLLFIVFFFSGCRSSIVNAEARTLRSASMARKCILIRSEDLTHARYLEVLDKGPSAIVILLQGNTSQEEVEVASH